MTRMCTFGSSVWVTRSYRYDLLHSSAGRGRVVFVERADDDVRVVVVVVVVPQVFYHRLSHDRVHRAHEDAVLLLFVSFEHAYVRLPHP